MSISTQHLAARSRSIDGGDAPKLPLTTRYTNMLLALDHIPRSSNLLASFFTWILLAGFVLFPGTFASLGTAPTGVLGEEEVMALHAVQHVSLFVIAFVCCGIGAAGMCRLWWKWSENYIWIVNRIFLPGFMNSIAGIISTITSVYGAQHGTFTTPSKATIIVTSAAAGLCGGLMGTYTLWGVDRVRREHEREIGRERAGRHGGGVLIAAQGGWVEKGTQAGNEDEEQVARVRASEAPVMGIV